MTTKHKAALADHAALNDMRVNGFDPLAAARAYPRLVNALRIVVAHPIDAPYSKDVRQSVYTQAERLLRELGEI